MQAVAFRAHGPAQGTGERRRVQRGPRETVASLRLDQTHSEETGDPLTVLAVKPEKNSIKSPKKSQKRRS
jgi:hypothetical protein